MNLMKGSEVDQGQALDLSACRDPWTVAALLRQVSISYLAFINVYFSYQKNSISLNFQNLCLVSMHINGIHYQILFSNRQLFDSSLIYRLLSAAATGGVG